MKAVGPLNFFAHTNLESCLTLVHGACRSVVSNADGEQRSRASHLGQHGVHSPPSLLVVGPRASVSCWLTCMV